MNTANRDRSKAAARTQQQQPSQSNTATLDRPVCDEIKEIFVSSMTSTYDACLEARNRGISAGLQRFRDENSTGNDDFFAVWELEAEQILDSRSANQNALPSSQLVTDTPLDLEALDAYSLEEISGRYNYLVDNQDSLDDLQKAELRALHSHLEVSNVDGVSVRHE
jgi:hypothetical protein